MKKKEFIDKNGKSYIFNDAYFNSMTFISNKETDKNKIQQESINVILKNLSSYIENGVTLFFMKL